MQECFKIECDTRGTGTVLVRQENEGGYVLMCVLYTALCHIWQKSLVMWMYTFICFPFRFKYVTTTRSVTSHFRFCLYMCMLWCSCISKNKLNWNWINLMLFICAELFCKNDCCCWFGFWSWFMLFVFANMSYMQLFIAFRWIHYTSLQKNY